VKDLPGDDYGTKKKDINYASEGAGQVRHGVGVGNLAAGPQGKRMGRADLVQRDPSNTELCDSLHVATFSISPPRHILQDSLRLCPYFHASRSQHFVV